MSATGPPKTLSACVASTNPVKVNAAKASLSQCFPSKETTVVGQKVPSGVPDQPMSDAETRQGALNRAKGAIHAHPGHDLYFGIEGGIEEDSNKIMHCFAWIVVLRAPPPVPPSFRGSGWCPILLNGTVGEPLRQVLGPCKPHGPFGKAELSFSATRGGPRRLGAAGASLSDWCSLICPCLDTNPRRRRQFPHLLAASILLPGY